MLHTYFIREYLYHCHHCPEPFTIHRLRCHRVFFSDHALSLPVKKAALIPGANLPRLWLPKALHFRSQPEHFKVGSGSEQFIAPSDLAVSSHATAQLVTCRYTCILIDSFVFQVLAMETIGLSKIAMEDGSCHMQ